MTEAPVKRQRLRTEGLSKSFPGVQALSDLSLGVDRGEILGLVGENGAGKSTLLNILSGVIAPDAGEILGDGQPLSLRDYKGATAAGIFRVFQEGATIAGLRVYESLFLSHESHFRRGFSLDRGAMVERSREAIAGFGLDLDVRRPIGDLDLGTRQSLEIVRALALADLLGAEHPVLLLDEPTTALDSAQDTRLLGLIDDLRGRAAVVFVSHRLPEVLQVCDRICVLKDGRLVSAEAASNLDESRLHALMVGRERARNYYRESEQESLLDEAVPPVLRVDGIEVPGEISPASLEVRPGEIVGIGGLQGSGRSLLGKAIAGIAPVSAGTVAVGDDEPRTPDFHDLVDRGLAWVAGDRHGDGMIADASVLANFQLASIHDRFSRGGIWRSKAARREADHWIRELEIRPPLRDARLGSLSGGNQQKVILAKWLCREPRVVILENPTQGVDTGARESLYGVIRELTAAGVGVVLITDDLTELIGLSDRILILVGGHIVGGLSARPEHKPDEKEVVELMSRRTIEVAA
ncbi:MAG: sugar ABC transporter ATP-binding protein [Solirubrobacterales bacterium]